MRVDRGGGKGFINENSRSEKDSAVQKKGSKKTEESAENKQDSASLQNESKIDPGVVSGRKEESELTARITRQFLSAELTGPSEIGEQPAVQKQSTNKKEEPVSNVFQNESKMDGAAISGQKQESEFTAKMTRQYLSAELPQLNMPEESALSVPVFGELPELQISSRTNTDESSIIREISFDEEAGPAGLESMSPEQKSTFVQKILNQPVTSESGEILNSVLLNARDQKEFNRIIESAGEKNIVNAFEDKDMKIQWDRLAGAYDRIDFALNPDEATKTQGILTGGMQELQTFLPEAMEPLLLKTNGESGPIDLSILSRASSVCMALENAVRVQDGHPMIVPSDLREKVFDILNVPDQPKEQRTSLLNALRDGMGLTEFQMREIVSLPLAEAFQSVIVDLTEFRDQKLQSFQTQIEKAIVTDGPDSIIVEIARAEQSEFIENIEPEINIFRSLQQAASEIFSGPADPLVKIDSVVHSILNDFVPPTQQLNSLIDKLAQGSQVFEPGRLDVTLQKIARLQIPEMKNFVAQGVTFFNGLSKLVPDIQVLAPELKAFQFLSDLHTGIFHRQITDFKQAIQEYRSLPQIQQSLTELNQWRKEYPALKGLQDRRSVPESALKMLEGFTQEALMKRWAELSNKIEELDLTSEVEGMIAAIRTMGDLVVSFRNGHFVQILGALNHRMAGSPAILQIIQQGLHLTNSGAGFFHALFNREWERPITQALKKNPGSKELTEAQSIFSDALNLFLPLESIDNLNPFLQYQKQLGLLRNETLMSNRIHRHLAAVAQ